MKKLLGIVVLGLLWCNVGFAMSQQEAIDKHLSGRKLDTLEGVWSLVETGQIILYFKTGNIYQFYDLTYPRYDPGRFEKGSDNYYYGRGAVFSGYDFKNPKFGNQTISINGNSGFLTLIISNQQPIKWTQQRIWPTNFKAHNAKFGASDSEKIEMASMIDKAKDTCKILGFTEGTDKFADCSLKLYTQSIELAAQNNQQVVIQNQGSTSSSGSNVMTIYDPVRDNNALIKRGQGLINGTCTLANLSTC